LNDVTETPVAGTAPVEGHASDLAHIVVEFDDNRLVGDLYGQFDQNLAIIEHKLGVDAAARGNKVSIKGTPDACALARQVLDSLYQRLEQGHTLHPGDVDGAVRMAETASAQLNLPAIEPRGGKLALGDHRHPQENHHRPQPCAGRLCSRARPGADGVRHRPGWYRQDLSGGRLCRSPPRARRCGADDPVASGGGSGRDVWAFLPGDMKEKIDPYLRPLYDALYDMMPADKVEKGLQNQSDRDRAAGVHARTHAVQCGGDPR
jgi:phosphate starvation-inducible PhoH-like protein